MTTSKNCIRIGGASGFWGDSQVAVPQLLAAGVDYLVFDYLAELTMSLLVSAQSKDASLGYAVDFVHQVVPYLKSAREKGVRMISNAGGANPAACAAALAAAAAKQGLHPKIAVVHGDNVMPLTDELRRNGAREMQSGEPLPPSLSSANAYLGALPIRLALDKGADIVITGRCVDSAVTLGVLMHEFDWKEDEYDKLAMGSLAGHLIECGCQATGGLHTDWRQVPGWDAIGYPIVIAAPDGGFSVTKPAGTGGLVTVPVLAEQMLYEVGNPAAYVMADVVCDFTNVQMSQAAEDVVAVSGARGSPPTPTYKVCATYADGFRAVAQLTIVGFEASAKAERTAQAVLARTRALFREQGFADYSATLVEVLGAESGFGPHSRGGQAREVVMRLAVSHTERKALDIFAREIAPAGTSWAPGTTGVTGRPVPSRVLKQFSFLLDKTRVAVTVEMDQTMHAVQVPQGASMRRPSGNSTALPVAAPDQDVVEVPLIDLAYARSGDKGDICNIGVIARSPALVPYLRRELMATRIGEYLAHLVAGTVKRYEVPGIDAFNFVLEKALGGGGMASLRNDPWGKSMAQILLAMPVVVPVALVPQPERRETSRQGGAH